MLTAIDTWLTAANQQAKAGRIDAAYPNAEGAQGANDSYVSFMELSGLRYDELFPGRKKDQ